MLTGVRASETARLPHSVRPEGLTWDLSIREIKSWSGDQRSFLTISGCVETNPGLVE